MKEALILPSLSINPQVITCTHVTMESDKLAQIFGLSVIVWVDELREEHPDLINDPLNVLALRYNAEGWSVLRRHKWLLHKIGLAQKVEKHELFEMR
ncbi:hypothetical protein H6P81_010394 [Aristolochia fimbriata]|uniref:Uncharacterized protein n=1 Tax=Aristolochia fimbriata TaxID=158543 RepID=A0AAV7EPU6_ARIFI|nr:hypothetical protein H6P81_010394 [Aristolochia fimbriata]